MRALCVLHDAFSTTGLIGESLRARGWQVDEALIVPAGRYDTPNVDFSFPDHREYDLLVPMGAPWSAYDEATVGRWLVPELDWLARAATSGGAVFGICFGAQALCAALGGRVEAMERKEIGWTMVDSADPELIPAGPWLEFHGDRCLPPPRAAVLARNGAGVQAFRLGGHLAVQFHPEVDGPQLKRWLDAGGRADAERAGLDPDRFLADTIREEPAARRRAGRLVAAAIGLRPTGEEEP